MTKEYDYLVIGSGIAGMSFALKVAGTGRVALVCKTTLDEANTALAQGGRPPPEPKRISSLSLPMKRTAILWP